MATFEHILVPVDFDEPSDSALAYAIALAKALGADITVLHAFEVPSYGFPGGALVVSDEAEMAKRILVGAQAGLAALVDKNAGSGVALKMSVREGRPAVEIEAAAQEIGADLVVMGTHGRRGLSRALLGSVAEEVVRTSRRPVLTVHGPRHGRGGHHGRGGRTGESAARDVEPGTKG
jgi:nucleotide-binding universal stress UspA family protein